MKQHSDDRYEFVVTVAEGEILKIARVDNQDGFYFKLTDAVTLCGLAKEFTGELTEVTILSTPQTAEDAGAALLAYVLVVSTLSPELTVEQRGELFSELRLSAETISELQGHIAIATRGNVKYSAYYDEQRKSFSFSAGL